MKTSTLSWRQSVLPVLFAVALFLGFGLLPERGYGFEPDDYIDPAIPPKLNLSPEQVKEIHALSGSFRKDVRPLQVRMLDKRNELKLLWLERTPDKKKIAAVQEEIRALKNQMKDKRDTCRHHIYDLLNDDQKEKLKSYGSGRGHRHNMRGASGMHGDSLDILRGDH